MRRNSTTHTIAADAALTIPAGSFANAGLLQVLVILSAASANPSAVTVSMQRGALTAVTLGTITMNGGTTGIVTFESPIVLTDSDKLIIDATATTKGGTAIVNTEVD